MSRPEIDILYVPRHGVPGVFSRVGEDLKPLEQDFDWTVDEVYNALVSGAAHLFIGFVDGEYKGFVTLYKAGDSLIVWQMVSHTTGVLKHYMWWIDNLAKEWGCKDTKIFTKRKGFSRMGFEYSHSVYRREV